MELKSIDWVIIIAFFLISLTIGIIVSKQAGKNTSEFFLSGRKMPWWLLGISMVATTFSADTPNLVADIVRNNGVSGNWVWWSFLLTGMLTVFVYAKLWRRSEILTDLEFYELRYSGKAASFLRGFRAIYLGFFFNIVAMAGVCLAAIKIGGVLLGLSPVQVLLISSIVTVVYSSLGGLKGVLITDFFQFFVAMTG
ncbi:MAG TPA: Na+:solute symporter, partial [Arenibacter sp.]|nr:Na+:solute symporter [Arenibacter sp.]